MGSTAQSAKMVVFLLLIMKENRSFLAPIKALLELLTKRAMYMNYLLQLTDGLTESTSLC